MLHNQEYGNIQGLFFHGVVSLSSIHILLHTYCDHHIWETLFVFCWFVLHPPSSSIEVTRGHFHISQLKGIFGEFLLCCIDEENCYVTLGYQTISVLTLTMWDWLKINLSLRSLYIVLAHCMFLIVFGQQWRSKAQRNELCTGTIN